MSLICNSFYLYERFRDTYLVREDRYYRKNFLGVCLFLFHTKVSSNGKRDCGVGPDILERVVHRESPDRIQKTYDRETNSNT